MKEKEKYGFSIMNADRIFDFLLLEGQIKLSVNRTIPLATEFKNSKYYKWHNAVSHNTCECRMFCNKIQSAIEQGWIKFDAPEKPIKIDGHPFPANIVDVKDQDAKTGGQDLDF